MKALKRILLGIGIIVLAGVSIIIGSVIIDSYNTSYLKISKHPKWSNKSYLLKNINIIPMTSDTVLRRKMVLIKDGLISEISDDISTSGIAVIDGKDGYLMPGLMDMHVHVWDDYELGLYLANGVTTLRNLWGQPMHLRMKKSISKEEIIAPMFFTSSPKLTGPNFMGDDNLQLLTPEQARKKVREYQERGYDFIKTYNGLPENLFNAILQESKLQNLDIVAHPSAEVPYSYHFKPEIISIEHAEDIVQQPLEYRLDTAKLNKVVDLFTSSPDAALCPTLTVYHNIYRLISEDEILNAKAMRYMNPLILSVDSKAQYDRWTQANSVDPSTEGRIKAQHEFHLLAVKKLHERGVNIVAGTDAGIGVTLPGYSIHQELEFYTQAGMSHFEAIKTATINPTKTHDFLKNLGSIEIGKTANLLLLRENPLEDLSHLKEPKLLFIQGRKISRKTLNNFENRAQNRNNLIVSVLRYVEYLMVER
tara:strand:+ start:2653 stop:4086 length:1434 start_codon:yes stop_codon:yes gene_type:complete